jgi:CheY-like chemotaxis protein
VGNGEEAVAAWRTGSWDVILMDVHMPVMDGPTAVRLIRETEAREGRMATRIIAVTANAMDHQVQEYLDLGMDGHIAKPILAAELFAVLEAIQMDVADRQAAADPPAEAAGAALAQVAHQG